VYFARDFTGFFRKMSKFIYFCWVRKKMARNAEIVVEFGKVSGENRDNSL